MTSEWIWASSFLRRDEKPGGITADQGLVRRDEEKNFLLDAGQILPSPPALTGLRAKISQVEVGRN